MKKLYFVGMSIILLIAISFIAYGTYLNKSDESQIQMRMESRTIPLQGATVKVRNIKPTFRLDTINLTSKEIADAVALIDGRIESALVDKNTSVAKGQTLFELVNEDIPLQIQQAESEIAKAEAEVLRAKNSFDRYEKLRELDATSLEKYDEAKLNYAATQANLKEAHTKKSQLLVKNSRQKVTAPISGEILILYKQLGAFVTAGTPIALIGNFEKLEFSLPAEDAKAQNISVGEKFEVQFKKFQKAYDTDYGAGNLGSEQIFTAQVKEIIPNLNQPAALRKIIFEIDNSALILEQQTYSDVTLRQAKDLTALTVPVVALNENNFVFVLTPENTLERREVKKGADDGEYAEILSGLSEGETVITSATKGLEEGMKVTVNLTD